MPLDEISHSVNDCFLCGKPFGIGNKVFFDTPDSSALPMHDDCARGRGTLSLAFNYHLKLTEVLDGSRSAMAPHLKRGVVRA